MASKTYVVTAPLATPYREDGARLYLYEGAEVPGGLRDGEVERLLDVGLIGEADTQSDEKPAAKKSASK